MFCVSFFNLVQKKLCFSATEAVRAATNTHHSYHTTQVTVGLAQGPTKPMEKKNHLQLRITSHESNCASIENIDKVIIYFR